MHFITSLSIDNILMIIIYGTYVAFATKARNISKQQTIVKVLNQITTTLSL